MIFCKIDDTLVNIIRKLAKGRTVVDCGCGDGMLGSMLNGVISIDLICKNSELIPDVLHMDVTEFPFNSQHFPVFIRPCHSTFVIDTIQKNKNILQDCLYVSNPRNLAQDIDLDEFDVEEIPDWTGQGDEEKAYLIKLNGNSGLRHFIRTFMVLRDSDHNWPLERKNRESYWMELTGNRMVNIRGGFSFYHEGSTEVLEEAYAKDFEDLDWSNTTYNSPDEKSGWIAPDGTFYGCPEEGHSMCADLVIRKSMDQCEKEGYAHLYRYGEYFCDKPLTEAQIKCLIDKGINIKESHLSDNDVPLTLGSWESARKYFYEDDK